MECSSTSSQELKNSCCHLPEQGAVSRATLKQVSAVKVLAEKETWTAAEKRDKLPRSVTVQLDLKSLSQLNNIKVKRILSLIHIVWCFGMSVDK